MTEENKSEEEPKEEAVVVEENSVESAPQEDAVVDGQVESEVKSEGDSSAEGAIVEKVEESTPEESVPEEPAQEEPAPEEVAPEEAQTLDDGVKEESPEAEEPEKVEEEGAKKILDVLDQQAKDDAKEDVKEDVKGDAEEGEGDVVSLDEAPLSEDLPLSSESEQSQQPDGQKGSIDPEKMISEAMKKLDQILDDIKEEGDEAPTDTPEPPVSDENDTDSIQK